jgi:hypothetical protein
MAHVTLVIFFVIAIFHVYMGLGGKLNQAYVLPTINGTPLPCHSLVALPVAILMGLSTVAFAHEAHLTGPLVHGIFWERYLWLTGMALLIRGVGGLIGFHGLNRIIDPGLFKTWDLRLYSPLCTYLGTHCLIVLN